MGLIVWLPLNGDMRNSGLGNATLASTAATFTDGPWGKALSCNGSTYWTVNGITLGNEATIACWGKTSASSKMKWVLQANVYAHLNLFESSIYTLNTGDSNNNPFKDGSNTVAVLTDNKWHHFVVTFGNSQAKLYIDGQYRGTATTFKSPACSNSNIRIAGGFANGHSYDYNGAIDDFRVYDHCLTEDDIKNLYNCKTFDLVNQCNVAFDRAGQIASGVIPYNVTTSGSAFYLNGSNASIRIPFTESNAGVFTMNTWFYKDSFGSKSWETILGGPSGFELEMKRSGTNSPRIAPYSWGGGSSNSGLDITYALNQWNMLTMVRNTSKTMFYLNGEYKVSGSAGSVPATSSTAGQYFIGAWKTYDAQNFKGYIKDFQIYAKELQASEIFQLYKIGPQTDTDFNQNYTRLEYIESTGTQWINTNVKISSTSAKYGIKFEMTTANSSFCPFGTEYFNGSSNVRWGGLFYGCNKAGLYVGTSPGRTTWKFDANVSYNLTLEANNGTYKTTCNGSALTGTYAGTIINDLDVPIHLFGLAHITTSNTISHSYHGGTKMKLKEFYVYDGDTLVFYGLPVKRISDNVLGLYDIVSHKFKTNAGSGTFTAGPAI